MLLFCTISLISFFSTDFIRYSINICYIFICKETSLDVQHSLPSQIAEFNIWNYEMTLEELLSETCGNTGNVASWETLNEKGTSVREYQTFPSCKGRYKFKFNFVT